VKKEEPKDLLIGGEIAIKQVGVPYGLFYRRTEPGYLLANGIALLECERDSAGRYKGGAGMDGMYLQTGRLYVPVLAEDGNIRAFQEVCPANYLAAAEMSVEGNYNQIDGIINNKPPRPSVLDALNQCREDAAKNRDAPKKPPQGKEAAR
jgi:hypothetical protein